MVMTFAHAVAAGAWRQTDETGTFVGSSFAHATARDWTRFGQLYMQDGVWDGERILPEGWVEFSTTPAAASLKGPRIPKPHSYGAQLWLNQPMEAGYGQGTHAPPVTCAHGPHAADVPHSDVRPRHGVNTERRTRRS